jgi:hypothetical protein
VVAQFHVRYLAGGGKDAEGDRQIESRAFLLSKTSKNDKIHTDI